MISLFDPAVPWELWSWRPFSYNGSMETVLYIFSKQEKKKGRVLFYMYVFNNPLKELKEFYIIMLLTLWCVFIGLFLWCYLLILLLQCSKIFCLSFTSLGHRSFLSIMLSIGVLHICLFTQNFEYIFCVNSTFSTWCVMLLLFIYLLQIVYKISRLITS